MKKIAIILCLIGCVSLASAKETIYVKYEPASCIQQFYYQAATTSNAAALTEYYDYHVNIKDNERTVIRTKKVGTYKKADYAIAKNLVNCANKERRTFQSLTGKIATGEKEIFFIEEQGADFHVYKGMSASYEMYNEKYFYSHSPDYSFKYIYNKDYVPSEQIKEDSKSGVITMFAGKNTKECNRQFGILQIPANTSEPQVTKEFLKNIGLYTEQNGDGLFILRTIDRMLFNDYLKWRCSGFQADLSPNNLPNSFKLAGVNTAKGGNQNYSQQINTNEILAVYNQNGNTAKGGNSIPTQYNQTVNTDNFIIAAYEGNDKKESTSYQYKNDKIVPTQYDAGTKKGTTVKLLKGRHVVVKGDTLYSLSKKYGASVDEMKSWNNLPDNTLSIGDTIVVNKSAFVF